MVGVIAPTRIKLQNILFATDFSASAQLALAYALNLVHHYDAGLYLVNVLSHVPFAETVQPDPWQIRLSAEQKMTDLTTLESFQSIRHTELIEEGEVTEVLWKLVPKYDIDLIVIGTGGRKGVQKLLLGSVAEEVFRNAECPVLTVGPHVTRREIDGHLQHIVYASDFGPGSIHALPYAVSLAEENRARLTMLHVAPEPSEALLEPQPGSLPVFDREEVAAYAEKQLRDLIPAANELWHAPEYIVQFGPTAENIVRVAETADMIVLGVKRPTPLTKHLGAGVAYKVACEASCPVLSIGVQHHD